MLNHSDTLDAPDIDKHLVGAINLMHKASIQLPLVMVIDDDVDSLVLMCHVLEKFACIPLCETSGRAALDTINNYKPDLVVLDIRLPGVGGLEIMRSLKEREVTRTIPIVVTTALAGYKAREEVLHVGCDHYITKPYLLTDLEQLMHSYLVRNT